jgi:two-component system OmpR family sensor kinase
VHLCLEQRLGEAILIVADDGPGIPVTDHSRIFERFYRGETKGARRFPGSGLGLPIARAAVELHGGRIWVEGGPGEGTTFSIALPLAGPDAAATETVAP